jgi:putative transposase
VKGRKRHLVVDTLGLALSVVVHPANVQERDGAKPVLERLRGRFPRLERLWADGGDAGQLVEWVRQECGWTLEIVKRSDKQPGFTVLPHRWIVERTFGWLGRFRRLSTDYEACTKSSEATILIAMMPVMLRRLEPA